MGRGRSYSERGNYRDFAKLGDKNKANDTFQRENKDFYDNITKKQRESIEVYTGSAYTWINSELRNAENLSTLDETTRDTVKNFNESIKNFDLKENTIFHRYSGHSFLKGLGLNLNPSMSTDQKVAMLNSVAGSTFVNKGFTSSGTHHEKQFGPVHYEILTPKGSKFGAFVRPFSTVKFENEFLFTDHMRFRLAGARNDHGVLTVTIIPVKRESFK